MAITKTVYSLWQLVGIGGFTVRPPWATAQAPIFFYKKKQKKGQKVKEKKRAKTIFFVIYYVNFRSLNFLSGFNFWSLNFFPRLNFRSLHFFPGFIILPSPPLPLVVLRPDQARHMPKLCLYFFTITYFLRIYFHNFELIFWQFRVSSGFAISELILNTSIQHYEAKWMNVYRSKI